MLLKIYYVQRLNNIYFLIIIVVIETADTVILKFENASKAISLTQLTKFAETLPQIKINLERMRIITKDLRINASQLNDGKIKI